MVKKFYVRGKHQKAVRRGGEISGGVYVILALQAAYNMELNFQTERKIMRKGFTLIELLVVVLIIGILASVALPQYYKSVEKTRFSEVIEFTRAFMDAQNESFMRKGSYETSMSNLPLCQKTGNSWSRCNLTYYYAELSVASGGGPCLNFIINKPSAYTPLGCQLCSVAYNDTPFKFTNVTCYDKNGLHDAKKWLIDAINPNLLLLN